MEISKCWAKFFFCCLIVVTTNMVANGEESVLPLPIQKIDRHGYIDIKSSSIYFETVNPIGISVTNVPLELEVPVTSLSELPEARVLDAAYAAIESGDFAAYYDLSAESEVNARISFKQDQDSILIDHLASSTEAAIAKLTRIGDVSLVQLSEEFGNRREMLLISNDGPRLVTPTTSVQPFKTLNVLSAAWLENGNFLEPISVDSNFKMIQSRCDPGSACPDIKLYFKGRVPTWGRRVLVGGEFKVDESEADHKGDSDYGMIRFIRDTWRIYSEIPNDDTVATSAAFDALLKRLTVVQAENLKSRLVTVSGVGIDVYSKVFRVHFDTIDLLYIIDADPLFLVFWTPLVSITDDAESDQSEVFGTLPVGWSNLYAIDILQRTGDSFFFYDYHASAGSSLSSLFYWGPIQTAMQELIDEQLVEE